MKKLPLFIRYQIRCFLHQRRPRLGEWRPALGWVTLSASYWAALLGVLQALAEEVEQWQTKVDALNTTARKLLEEYSGDDTAKVRQSIDKTNARWTQLLSRWEWLLSSIYFA